MRVLILHRIPYHKIDYARGIDHELHDVTYFGKREILDTLPANLRCERIERPGLKRVAMEALEILGLGREFDRIISLSEYELLDAAELREAYAVSGPVVEEILRVRDKIRMKEAVEAAGLRVPRFQPCTELGTETDSSWLPAIWKGPTVLKPVDGASAENVILFETRKAASEAVLQGRTGIEGFQPDRFEIEEFVTGPVLHIDGLVQHGTIVTVLASRYLGTCLDYAQGMPLGSVQLDPARSFDLFHWAQKVIAAVGLRTGSFHLETILTGSGPVFLEIGGRVGGADVVDTFELATGIHLPSAELELLLETETRPVEIPRRRADANIRYGWFVFPGHHLRAGNCLIEGTHRFRGLPGAVRWNELPPDRLLPRNITYQSREVPVAGILCAETTERLEAMMKDVFKSVRVIEAPPKTSVIMPTARWV